MNPTEIYRAVEGAKGELGIYIRSDGTDKAGAVQDPQSVFLEPPVAGGDGEGSTSPDVVAALGSLDIVLGEVDR